MSDVLMLASVGELGQIRAMVDPALVNTAYDKLIEARQQADAATAELREQQAANQAILDKANKTMADAKKLFAEVEAEKKAFTEVREAVDAGHRDREAELSRHASELSQHEDDLTQREADLGQREATVAAEEKKLAGERQALVELHEQHAANVAKYEAVRAAIAAVD